jgi:hypothetical protein
MSPKSRELGNLILSAKAYQLAHDALGTRGHRMMTGLLVLSAIFGYLAGAAGLAALMGKTAASALGIVAGLVSTGALLALTTLKPGDHLRVAGQYQALFLATMQVDEGRPGDGRLFQEWREGFNRITDEATTAGIRLTNGQVRKYEREAREQLEQDIPADAEMLDVTPVGPGQRAIA